jgi:hypothetical protein
MQPFRRLARCDLKFSLKIQQRTDVVGNGNIDVGNKTATGNPGRSNIEHLPATDSSAERKTAHPGICGAMSQQCGDNGNVSAPQKLVQLVGYREPRARPDRWVRPGPAKR